MRRKWKRLLSVSLSAVMILSMAAPVNAAENGVTENPVAVSSEENSADASDESGSGNGTGDESEGGDESGDESEGGDGSGDESEGGDGSGDEGEGGDGSGDEGEGGDGDGSGDEGEGGDGSGDEGEGGDGSGDEGGDGSGDESGDPTPAPDTHDRTFVKYLTTPTCENSGIAVWYCTVHEKNEYTSVEASHVWSEGIVVKEATCLETGLMEYVCSLCGETKTEEIPLSAEHVYEDTYKAPNCEENAKAGSICTICGQDNPQDPPAEIEDTKLGHDLYEDTEDAEYKEATCEEAGMIITKCRRCDYVEKTEVAALEHDYEEVDFVEADCENAAGTASVCTRCGDEKVEAFEEGDDLYQAALGHAYEGKVTEPTCKDGGYTTYTCSRCGDTYTGDETEADATKHDYELTTVKTAATCTTNGVGQYTCSICGSKKYLSIPKAHTWGENTTNEAGTAVIHICTACGETEIVQEILDGYVLCPGCDKVIAPEEIPAVVPTCTDTGLTAGKKCSNCGEIIEAQETVPVTAHTFNEKGVCEVCDWAVVDITAEVDDNDGKKTFTFTSNIYVPDGYTVEQKGILYATSSSFTEADTADLVIDSANAKVHKLAGDVSIADACKFIATLTDAQLDRTLYGRGYIVIADADGEEFTYYTDVLSNSYNSLSGN